MSHLARRESGFRNQDSGFRTLGLGFVRFGGSGQGFTVLRFHVLGFGFLDLDLGFRL